MQRKNLILSESEVEGRLMFLQSSLVVAGLVLFASFPAAARTVTVNTPAAIVAAIGAARPGDVITVQPGTYELPGLRLRASGNARQKITLRAAQRGKVEFRSMAVEFIKITGSDWIVEGFDIAGICADDNECEHAFHIVSHADRTIVRDNRIRDYNAHIKGNGENGGFPGGVLIANNTLFDTRPRMTDNPIAPIDVVGGSDWIIRGNIVADFGKALSHPPTLKDDWSYGIFVKGNSERGIIEKNIVACTLGRPATPAMRGISFGGSITTPNAGLCDKGDDCSTEHRDGIIRNNLVLSCPKEPGIYLYRSARTTITGNRVLSSAGIEGRGPTTTANVHENQVAGRIWAEDDAMLSASRNHAVTDKESASRILKPEDAAMAGYRAYLAALTKR
jgi:parallel beta-helix repeat protein